MTSAVDAVKRARRRAQTSELGLRSAIAAAFNNRSEGHTVADIAEAAGLTVQRIYQIVKEHEQAAAHYYEVKRSTFRNDHWIVECSCGYRSDLFPREVEAEMDAERHRDEARDDT